MTSQFYQIEAVVQFSWLIDSFLAQRNAEMEKIISMCLNLLIWITERIYYQEMSSHDLTTASSIQWSVGQRQTAGHISVI